MSGTELKQRLAAILAADVAGYSRLMAPELVEARLAGQWMYSKPHLRRRAMTFLRIAAGLEDASAAEGLR